MPSQKISQDPVADALVGTELIPVVQAGVNKASTPNAISTKVQADMAAALGAKASTAYVDSENAAQDAIIADKADTTYVDAENATQDAAIALKADQTALDAALADILLKADITSVPLFVGPGRQFTTIQAALDFIGASANVAELKTPYGIFIAAGIYDEDLVIPQGRIINLLGEGTVVLGNGAGANWNSTNARNVTFTANNADVHGSDIKPALNIGVLNGSDATSTFITESGCFYISGNLNIAGDGLSHTINLHSVKIQGTVTKTAAGLTNLQAYRCNFVGAINAGTATILERAHDCEFAGLVTVDGYNSLIGCEVKAGMTVTTNYNTMPPSGFFFTTFTGVFTGPANSLKLDPSSDYFFTANGATLGGAATKVILRKSEVVDAINNGVTDTAPSQNAVFDALALKANSADVTAALALKADTTYVDAELATKIGSLVDDATPELGGQLDAATFKIVNAGDPVDPQDVATKAYVDASETTGISQVADDATPELGGQLDAATFKIVNAGDPTAAQDLATKAYVDAEVAGAGGGANALDDLTDVVISSPSAGEVLAYDLGGITGASAIGNSYGTAGDTSGPFFKPDGMKFYTSNAGNGRLRQHSCAIAWDLSSASYDGVEYIAHANQLVFNSWFRADGLKLYTTDRDTSVVREHDLAVAWDLSTAAYTGNSFNVGGQGTPVGVWFKNDGTKFFMCASNNKTIFEYNVGTPWDILTAAYSGNSLNVASEIPNLQCVNVSDDGLVMHLGGLVPGEIRKYNLSSTWDLSTAADSGEFVENPTINNSLLGFFIGNSGETLYLASGDGTVLDYTIPAPAFVNKVSGISALADDPAPALSAQMNAGNFRIINLDNPAGPQHAATKSYVDASIPASSLVPLGVVSVAFVDGVVEAIIDDTFFTDAYDDYLIVAKELQVDSGGGAALYMRVKKEADAVFDSAGVYDNDVDQANSGNTGFNIDYLDHSNDPQSISIPASPAQLMMTDETSGRVGRLAGTASGVESAFRMWIHGARNAANYTMFDVDGITNDAGTGHWDSAVVHKANTKIKGVRIYHDSGALDMKGKFYVYGLALPT